MSTAEENSPIKQDMKKGRLRHFTYGNIPFNYGALPQTWEDPNSKDQWTGLFGDNDPIDVVEISGRPLHIGAVHRIRIFGSLGLIDEGETDWKVIGVVDSANVTALSSKALDTIREWFRLYKTTDGKAENTFANNGELFGAEQTFAIINSAHDRWKALVAGTAKHNGLALPRKHAP